MKKLQKLENYLNKNGIGFNKKSLYDNTCVEYLFISKGVKFYVRRLKDDIELDYQPNKEIESFKDTVFFYPRTQNELVDIIKKVLR